MGTKLNPGQTAKAILIGAFLLGGTVYRERQKYEKERKDNYINLTELIRDGTETIGSLGKFIVERQNNSELEETANSPEEE